MDEKQREQVALFRYGLIAPLLNGQAKTQKEYLAEVSNKVHKVPYYGSKEFTPKTIQKWYLSYRKSGFDALKPKQRNDKGKTRAIKGNLKEIIINQRHQHLDMPVQLFYEHLLKAGFFLPNEVSYSTLNRYLRNHNLANRRQRSEPERKRFGFDKVNILWQGDISHGVYLKTPKGKVPTYLFLFIDDCSRIVPFAKFCTRQNVEPLKEVFKEGLLRRGLPRMVYVDNGKVYRSDAFNLICASLGISIIHTQPYDAPSKGKVERVFGTIRSRFYPRFKNHIFTSIDELNHEFWQWLEEDYHRKEHSALEMSPLDKYLSQISQVKMVDDPQWLEEIFWHRETRKVSHVATISLDKKLYEVPPHFIGQRIELMIPKI